MAIARRGATGTRRPQPSVRRSDAWSDWEVAKGSKKSFYDDGKKWEILSLYLSPGIQLRKLTARRVDEALARIRDDRCIAESTLNRYWRVHGVSFGEAIALLEHGRYIEAPDEREDYGEDRWVAAGQSPIRPGRLLLVAFTERGKIIRIIHARECSTREVERIFGDDA